MQSPWVGELELETNWINPTGQPPLRATRTVGHVFLNGVVEVPAAPGADPFVFYLPEGYVPTYNHYFVVNRIGVNPPTFYNITVGQTTPGGRRALVGTPTTGQHISLAGIHFRVDPPGFIALTMSAILYA